MVNKVKFIILFFSFLLCAPVSAQQLYTIIPEESKLQGSIRYTLIGKYVAHFEEFEGAIKYDPKDISKGSVMLKIKTDSINSKFPVLDKIVCSSRLLNAKKYPHITFESVSMEKTEGVWYRVEGDLDLNGIKKRISFPFMLEAVGPGEQPKTVKASGQWVMHRKDFEIIWSRILDHGGIVVGDHIIVDWTVVAGQAQAK